MTNVNIADFGFAEVRTDKKTAMVGGIFSQVAPYYDQMNDIMSGGFHRCWKSAAVAFAAIRPGMTILDLACGSGDLATRLLPYMTPNGHVILADINPAMLALARRRLQNYRTAQFTQCNGESLPFAGGSFDRIFIAFGLRNITYRQQALAEMHRVLRPGGQCIIVEFSPPQGVLAALRRRLLLAALPRLGQWCFDDADSYRYLAESILRFPPRENLAAMMQNAGLARVQWLNLAAGMVLLHHGRRLS